MTDYALSKASGVDPSTIRRFMTNERDLRGANIDRLAEALRLDLVERSRGRGRPSTTSRRDISALGPSTEGESRSVSDHPINIDRNEGE